MYWLELPGTGIISVMSVVGVPRAGRGQPDAEHDPLPGAGTSAAALSAFLRDHRRAAGLTQRDLAARAGVGVGVVRDLEQGVTRYPRPGSVARIAAALGVDTERIARAAAAADAAAQAPAGWVLPQDGVSLPQASPGPKSRPVPSVRLGVLGPLAAWRGDDALALGPVRQRTVLGVLAVRPNTLVHRDVIAQALWGDAQPASAVTMIQSYLSQLRRALSDGPAATGPLASAGTAYRLLATADDLDLLAFSRLLRAARDAAAIDSAAPALDLYQQALSVWRGEPLADLDALRDDPAVVGLSRQRAAAVVEWAGVAGPMGAHDQVLAPLQALADREPLNERAHACLMIALAGCGQQAAALDLYEKLRRRLDDQLGVRPGREVTDAHLRVLRGTIPAPPRRPPRPGAPPPRPDGPNPAEPPAAADRGAPAPAWPVCQLPAATADFTGRAGQIRLLAEAVRGSDEAVGVPLVAISGLPGSGKTALALQAAHHVRAAFPDGQLWVSLDGASQRPRDPSDVLGELLRALGMHGLAIPDRAEERSAAFRSLLADRRMLIIADDAASASQVRALLPGTAGSAVIVTSRTQLTDLEGARLLPLDPLPHAEAISLLARIVGPERVDGEPEAASQLVTSCGRLPLAVRIAGARLAARPSWPLALLTERLADQHSRLDELQTTGLSVRASLTLSYLALDELPQRAYRLIGLLGPADFAEWVIAALLGIPDASDVVNDLANCSLLTSAGTDATGQPRYRLHDLLRDYAVERLADEPADERGAAVSRALDAWLQFAAVADGRMPSGPYFPRPDHSELPRVLPPAMADQVTRDAIAWFTAERANALTAIELACSTGALAKATRLAVLLASYQHFQSRVDDTDQAWRAILSAARQAGDTATAAYAELRLVVSLCSGGAHADAMPIVRDCAEQFARLADKRNLVVALYWLAVCEFNLGFFARARRTITEALVLARQLADRQTEFLALRILALSQTSLPDSLWEGVRSIEEALVIVRELAEPAWEMEVLHTTAHIYNVAGQYEAAIKICHKGVDIIQRLDVPVGQFEWDGVIADAYYGLGRYQEAADILAQAVPGFRDHFMRRHQALALLKLGYANQAMGKFTEAISQLEQALPIFCDLRLPHYEQRVQETIRHCRNHQFVSPSPVPRAQSDYPAGPSAAGSGPAA
jgi:DNA-binding SARP family transcriptional activator/transcriptional regulator with XRE-family HTH domain